MRDQVQELVGHLTLPARAELPPRVRELLPAWDSADTMSAVGDFDGYFLAGNAGYFQVLGWSTAALVAAPFWEFVHPDDRDGMVESFDRLMTASEKHPVATAVEVRRLRRDGHYCWTRWDMAPDPAAERLYGIGADISAEKPPIDDVTPVGVWVRDVDGRTVDWSDELYAMFGLPPGAPLTDAEIVSRIHPQDQPLVTGAWRASMADRDAHSANFRAIRPDGTVRHLHSTGRVTTRSGTRPVTVRGITVDVTDRESGFCRAPSQGQGSLWR